MNKELLEDRGEVQDSTKEKSYHHYQDLGGIINEGDYNSAIERLKNTTSLNKATESQAESIANFAGIELTNHNESLDKRVILYGILRSDVRAEGIKHHHDEMSDQRIFMEALKMLEDVESVNKMIKAYPHISFKYSSS